MSIPRIVLRASRSPASSTRTFSTHTVLRSVAEPAYKAPALGVNRTYDEALKIIGEDKIKRLADVKKLETSLTELLKATPSAAEVAELKESIFKQEAYAEINDPEIQWRFKNGQVDMSKAVFRFMKSKQFQRETLPVVQQRITQMFVTPDVVPVFTPTLNVQLDYGSGSTTKKASGSSAADNYFEAGSYLLPGKSIKEPKINVTSFHSEQKYYTVALVDPDMPDVENQSFKHQLHWLMSNVSLSATQTDVIQESADVLLPYVPPHPPKGTKYHRYTLVVAEQPNNGQDKVQIDRSQVSRETTVRDLCSQYNLDVKGLTFFRQVWDKDVSKIYKEILQQEEPVYGKQPKVDELLDETGQMKRKYVNL